MMTFVQSFEVESAEKFGVDIAILLFHFKISRYEVLSNDISKQIAPSFPYWSLDKVRSVFNRLVQEPYLEGYIQRSFAPVNYTYIYVNQHVEEIKPDCGISVENNSDCE